MPFGPEISVAVPPTEQRGVTSVTLTDFGSDEGSTLFPFSPTDPALRFLGAGETAVTRNSRAFYTSIVRDSSRLVWGIKAEGKLAGFVGLDAYEHSSSPNFTIALAERARGKRIGWLATVGVVSMAFAHGFLHDANDSFDPRIVSLETVVHPENHVSQAMCETVGFVERRRYVESYRGRRYPWIEYTLEGADLQLMPGPDGAELYIPGRTVYSVVANS